ncbi:MAG: membrane protein insertion efficiency factor YidD [Candidatus Omnitrophica bacterium]|nr:membrane protein insertion efficiency factor YidD [Candidatus Omnitrophota bacterium]
MLTRLCLAIITWYQILFRPLLPQCCRFHPSCSEYAKEAFFKYGILKGGFKAVRRLLHCHPFSRRSGYDPLI